MRSVFVGNFELETRQSELEQPFSKFGRINQVDMKSGFAFVYYKEERDAEDAIQALDQRPFGYYNRRLSVEWAKGERGRPHSCGGSKLNPKPTRTLFVINFAPQSTRVSDIKKQFEPYGKVLHVKIRRNYAFVQFETQAEATKALEMTHRSKIFGRVVSVEYALKGDDERNDRHYDSPRRGSSDRHRDSSYGCRSPSPVYRSRPSPNCGCSRGLVYDRYNGKNGQAYDRWGSPEYGGNTVPELSRSRR